MIGRRKVILWMVWIVGLFGIGLPTCLVWSDFSGLPRKDGMPDVSLSVTVLDRNETVLRAFITDDHKWRLPVELSQIDPLYWRMLTAYEDRRFYEHSGVDFLALARAAYQLLTTGRVVSGGSTLTMQVARLLKERPTRSFSAKYWQILEALRLERDLTKDEILALYALRSPFGGNIEGLRAASLVWFGREPRRLTPAQAALLVALPQSPETRRPDRHPEMARQARARVLARSVERGVLSAEQAKAAENEPIPEFRRTMPFLAAHAARSVVAGGPGETVHRLTIDSLLQASLENLVRRKAKELGRRMSAAVIVADHQTGDILASIGSPDLLDERRLGHIDMTEAIRSPGSTLKPLIYGLAFEQGLAHPESYIEDRPIDIGGYRPTNFDLAYQGRISVREALQLSLNTPAVQLLEAVGPARLIARMKRSGARPVFPNGVNPGLAIGLGGAGVSLHDLTQLYAALGNRGRLTPLKLKKETASSRPDAELKVMEPAAAWYLSDILTGLPQPHSADARRLAYKTGTAYGYRDAWAIGYDGRHVIGVWTGRADGTPTPGMTGAASAAPILFEAFQRLKRDLDGFPPSPPGILKTAAAELPLALRTARVSKRARPEGEGFSITYPPHEGVVDLGLETHTANQPLVVKLRGGGRPYRWFVNGKPAGEATFASQITVEPDGPGATHIMVVDRYGSSKSVQVFLR